MKIKIYHTLVLLAIATFTSCNDWLDVTPKDKMLEDQQFSSEDNIYSATNGLYREMVGEHLYGGKLTQTTLETMGHIYTYPPNQPSTGDRSLLFYRLANFQYTSDEAKGLFAEIWKNAYSTLLHINIYIKNVEESQAVMSEKYKKILLGEAYGLRAYLHFDIFRVFGPVYRYRNGDKILPYNNKTEITLNHTGYEETEYSSADEYIALLLEDIGKAESLLNGNDPVLTDPESISSDLLNDNFFQNRNRRMNYYAVKGLEARIRQYMEDDAKAAELAKIITDQVGSDKIFNWVNTSDYARYYNYIFFSEVIFGINNLDKSPNATKWYTGTDMRDSYVVDYNNLVKNILAYEGNALSSMLDIRSKQWTLSNVVTSPGYSNEGTYRSNRYIAISDENSAVKDLQPLMRVSEMYYIQAEAALKTDKAKAVELLNAVLRHRGLTEQYYLTTDETDEKIQEHIEREYYREFFGEGQVFFFHKRRCSSQMFNGNSEGKVSISAISSYVVPVPEDETNI
ncbi:MAG: RagB/SusD family nutrient uptake outer membrane protein [Mediterranea sp.]|jgi:hypothetical protein|nr:RagB/SusD family nutrient uptake outer membrane protein [Mediterranea sp.]